MRRLSLAFLVSIQFSLPLATLAQDVTATGGGGSSGGGIEPAGFRSYGDDRSINLEEELDSLRSNNEGLVGSVKPQPVTFNAAVAKAQTLARTAVSPGALAAVIKRLPDNKPETLRLLAIREHAKSRPEAAFALLVAAYERKPDSADTLADLAGMLAGMGYANEALAILDEMNKRSAVPSPPMGISGIDMLAYIRGYCLVRLGDIAAAKPLLRGVAERQPQLAEASRLLAVIADGDEEQRKYFLQGVWRHRPKLMSSVETDLDKPEPDPIKDAKEVCADLRTLLDPEKGKVGVLPQSHYAKSVMEANDLVDKLEDQHQAAGNTFGEILSQRKDPSGFRHPESGVEEVWGHRMAHIMDSLDYRDRRVRDLERVRRKAKEEMVEAYRKIEQERTEGADEAVDKYARACVARNINPTVEQMSEIARPFFEEALNRGRSYANRLEKAERDLFAEWHLLATAITAQVGDKDWHEECRISIEAERWLFYQHLLQIAKMHALLGAHPGITRVAGEVPLSPAAQEVDNCNGNSPMQFGTGSLPGGDKLPFQVGVSLGCDGMALDVGVDTEIPGLSVNGEIAFDNRGEYTAFVGPKAELSVGHSAIASASVSAKAGMYVTGNRHGVTDVGVKYVASGSANAGSHSASQTFTEGSTSILPSPAAPSSGIEGLQLYGNSG